MAYTSEELVNPYCVTFELDDGNLYEQQFSTVPQYDVLWKTVQQWYPEAEFTISINGTVLTKSNTVELVTAAASCDGEFVLPDLHLHLQVRTTKPEEERPEPPRVAPASKNGTLAQIFCLVGALLVSGRYSLFPAESSPSNPETMFSVSLETIDHLREQLALQSAEIALLRSRATPIPVPRIVAKPCPSLAVQAEVAEKNATIIELRALLEKYGFTLERQYDEMYALRRRLRAAETCCSSVKQREDRCSGLSQTSMLSASSSTIGTMSAIQPYAWRGASRSVDPPKTARTPTIAPPATIDGSTRVLRRPIAHDEPIQDRSVVALADLTSRLQRLDNPLEPVLRSSLLRIVQAEEESAAASNHTDGGEEGREAPPSPVLTVKSTAITALLGTLNQHRGITIFDSEFQIKAPASGVSLSGIGDRDAESDATIEKDETSSSSSSSSSSHSSLALRPSTDVVASPAGYQKRWKSASMWKFDDEGEIPGRNSAKATGLEKRGQYFDGYSVPTRPVPMRYLA
jgi:hypothetical protein